MVKQFVIIKNCKGEAHRNPFIDHCMECAPHWEKYLVCSVCGKKLLGKPRPYKKYKLYYCKHCKEWCIELPSFPQGE